MIPDKKHDDRELQQLRMRNAMAVRPPVTQLKKQALHPWGLGVHYGVGLVSMVLVVWSIYPLGPIDERLLMIGMGGSLCCLLAAILVFWRKPRSRHHMTLMMIISLLVLVFGSVYYIEQFEQAPYDDAQGSLRY